jgi:DNA-binding HxlR family transcriptional regulator
VSLWIKRGAAPVRTADPPRERDRGPGRRARGTIHPGRERTGVVELAQALDQLGDSWTLLIIRDALVGSTRFKEFEINLGIAKNVLSDRLSKLVENGVLEKNRLDEPGHRFEYKLTAKGQ